MYSHEGTGGGAGGHKTEAARDAAGEVASTAGDQARSLAGEVRSEARHVTHDVQSRIREEAREQTRRTSHNLRQWSEELSSMAEEGDQRSPVSGVVRQVAQGGRGAADYLDEQGVEGLVEEARSFARRRPMAFLAGAAAAGFVLGRVLKASSSMDRDSGGYGPSEAVGAEGGVRTPAPRLGENDSGEAVAPPAEPGQPGRTY